MSVWLYKSVSLGDKFPKMIYIREFISYFNQYCEIIFFSPILANNNIPLKIYCESIVIIYTDFNLNVLLQLFFFLSLNKLFFFSPILTNNNLLLKIYCESIVKILWQYFSILISYSLFYVSLILFYFLSIFPSSSSFFSLFFSPPHMYP